ncbi:hypothetical protein COV61_04460 [Candidatus Micrarchaeota archaeon CG11_big_fil_rev_8_21_14_0_20_47_5]|nr:MAG: hypothetical protein AUJ17_05310 [Candidatus Micrarchaeota archaeon CG1_02_47_40]PIN82977.1 MAG: hypothetical protein COV61_04460 [Candidatus Micrarchaeota archaeon CG11_big_fil_rev_8_21_14_0_20_47_5]
MAAKTEINPLQMPKLRQMSQNRRLALAVSTIAAFLFLSFSIIFTYRLPPGYSFGLFDFLAYYHMEMMLLMAALGVAVGAFVFYLLYARIEQKEKESEITAEMLLNFLAEEERKILSFLAKGGGSAYQSEISRLEGMTRLRAHRALARLAKKGILSLERVGKTNKVFLSKPLYGAISKN